MSRSSRGFTRMLTALLLACVHALGQTTTPPPAPNEDPHVGAWIKNKDMSQPVKSDKYVYEEAYHYKTFVREGDEYLQTDKIGPAGWCCYPGATVTKEKETHSRYACDGKQRQFSFGTSVCWYVAPNTIQGKSVFDNHDTVLPRHKIVYFTSQVSSDGTELKNYEYLDPARTKLTRLTVWDKVK